MIVIFYYLTMGCIGLSTATLLYIATRTGKTVELLDYNDIRKALKREADDKEKDKKYSTGSTSPNLHRSYY